MQPDRPPRHPVPRRALPGAAPGLRLGRVAGVEVRLDWSLLIVVLLIVMALAGGVLPQWHPDWSQTALLLTATIAAVLFMASILLHELAHALVGRRVGVRIERITLFIFGGMAHMEGEPKIWQAELKMAIAGPLASLAIGILCLTLAGAIAGPIELNPDDPSEALSRLGPIATVLIWLGPVNIILALFNLVPGFPLDGGRVLRAVLWGVTGDLKRATEMAASSGQAFGWTLMGLGFAMILGIRVPIFGSGAVGGLWLALIGWFLSNAARQSLRMQLIEERLGHLPVTRVAHHDYQVVTPDASVQRLVDDGFLVHSQRCYPVVAADGALRGVVSLEDIRSIGRDQWAQRRVAEIMTPLERLQVITPAQSAAEALRLLAERGVNQLPLVADGQLRGLVTREDILKWMVLGR
jgi:Zn-dependent protease/CBS domain-containing protein